MISYGVEEHPILSAKAKALQLDDTEAFFAQAEVAESVLGIPATIPSGVDSSKLVLAVAMQVNFQIEQGLDPLILSSSSSSHARNSQVFRDRWIDPRAAVIARGAMGMIGLAGRYSASLTSFRYEGRKR
jgi:hypothetical protein